jgi:hypothetical protein
VTHYNRAQAATQVKGQEAWELNVHTLMSYKRSTLNANHPDGTQENVYYLLFGILSPPTRH